jgi:hypothetical protein
MWYHEPCPHCGVSSIVHTAGFRTRRIFRFGLVALKVNSHSLGYKRVRSTPDTPDIVLHKKKVAAISFGSISIKIKPKRLKKDKIFPNMVMKD